MAKYVYIPLFFTLLLCCSCSNNAPEIWGIKLGESKAKVISQLRSRGYDIDPTANKTVRVYGDIKYREVTWKSVEYLFDSNDKCNSISFSTDESLSQSVIDKLEKYILADGFKCTYDKEELSNRLQNGQDATISIGRTDYTKPPYTASISSDLFSSSPNTYMTYSLVTPEYEERIKSEEERVRDIQERLQRGESVTIEIDLDN